MTPHVVVLGSGTSNGVPIPGKTYPEAFLANPKNHRTRPSIALRTDSGNVLVDCGPDFRMQVLREGIRSVDACLITHTHADHIMGMDDLRPFGIIGDRPIPIYTAPRYQEDIRRVFAYAFQKPEKGIELPRLTLHDVPDRLEVVGLTIRSVWVEHGDLPVLGIRVNDFAYVTDVSHIPDESMAKLSNLECLILDAVRYRPHPNHFHYDRAIEVAAEIGAAKTYFTHLSDDYDHDEVNRQLPDGVELAYDGLKILL